VRLGSRWASTIASTATAALGVVLAMFAVSGPRVAVRYGESGHKPSSAAGDAAAATGQLSTEQDGLATRAAEGSFSAVRKLSTPTRRFPRGLEPEPFILRNPLRPGGPEITGIAATSAGYGHKVTIRGSRLAGARRVLFIGAEHGRALARFVVWDDNHLLASVPDLNASPQDAAVAVVTQDGVAVSVPADAPSVGSGVAVTPSGSMRVVRSGDVFDGDGANAVFVESGAAARALGGATLFVRQGGSLWGRGGGDCLVYCERGVVVRSAITACDIAEVDAVNPCVVASPFHYTGY
jgi:hypothetical protein